MTLLNGPNAPLIDVKRCSGCGRCVAACPLRLIALETAGYRKHAVITKPEHCPGCGSCIPACPVEAIAFPVFPA